MPGWQYVYSPAQLGVLHMTGATPVAENAQGLKVPRWAMHFSSWVCYRQLTAVHKGHAWTPPGLACQLYQQSVECVSRQESLVAFQCSVGAEAER